MGEKRVIGTSTQTSRNPNHGTKPIMFCTKRRLTCPGLFVNGLKIIKMQKHCSQGSKIHRSSNVTRTTDMPSGQCSISVCTVSEQPGARVKARAKSPTLNGEIQCTLMQKLNRELPIMRSPMKKYWEKTCLVRTGCLCCSPRDGQEHLHGHHKYWLQSDC